MKLPYTRKIIDAIHDGLLENVEFEKTPVFNLSIPKNVPGVPTEILNPKNTWRYSYIFLFLAINKPWYKRITNVAIREDVESVVIEVIRKVKFLFPCTRPKQGNVPCEA